MFKNLNAGAIGIRNFSLEQTIQLAQQTGYAGVDFNIKEAAEMAQSNGIDSVKKLFTDNNILPGAWSPPFDWRSDAWAEGVKNLPEYAAVAAELGALRAATWCPPSSTEREFDENFKWHVERFGGIAEALKPYNVRFGIEFIGPQTMRPANQHDFIYTLEGMLELCKAIGTGNVGILLDVWHLYTSGGQIADMNQLTNHDIVNVHVNDAPAGLTLAEYQDLDRRLPMETGVMPLVEFMRKLEQLGYDGPVTVEPFSQRVNSLTDPVEAAELTMTYMNQLWQTSGLT
jgi:sugar phosphate isomerase/epimerase